MNYLANHVNAKLAMEDYGYARAIPADIRLRLASHDRLERARRRRTRGWIVLCWMIGAFVLGSLLAVKSHGGELEKKGPRAVCRLSEFGKPGDDKDDTKALLAAIAAAYVVEIDAGVWDFNGQLISGENAAFARCRIRGPADESGAQHQEEDRTKDRFVSQLRIRGLKPGQHWIDWRPAKFKQPSGQLKADRGGPMGFEYTSVQILGDGCFMRLGDAGDENALGVDVRKLDLTGLYVTAPDQLAAKFDGGFLPSWAQAAMIEIRRGYDVKIARLGIRGGGTGLRLLGCDRPDVKNLHCMLVFNGLEIDNLAGAAGVAPATVSDVHVEHYCGAGVYATNAQLERIRCETGREVLAGVRKVTAPWSILPGANRVELDVDEVHGLDRLYRGAVVWANEWPLIVTDVDARGFSFAEADSHCYFPKAEQGAELRIAYGTGVVGRGDRFTLGAWSVDYNRKLPGLPVGAFAPHCETSVVGPYSQGASEFMDESNRAIVVAHSAGRQYAVEASVDFVGSMMRPDHPLCHPGIGPLPDPNFNRWLEIWQGDNNSKNLRFRQIEGRWTVRLDDAGQAGMTRPATKRLRLRVHAENPTTLAVYTGVGPTREYKLKAGWQTVEDEFSEKGAKLWLAPAPVSVELGQ